MKTFTEWEETTDGFSESEKSLMELAWNASAENSAEEIAKLNARIDSLTAAGAEYQRQCFEQAAEISRLKALVEKCKEVLEDSHQNINQERRFASDIKQDIEQTLAAIKEEGL